MALATKKTINYNIQIGLKNVGFILIFINCIDYLLLLLPADDEWVHFKDERPLHKELLITKGF